LDAQIEAQEQHLAGVESTLSTLDETRAVAEAEATRREREFKTAEKEMLKFAKEIEAQVRELPEKSRKAARAKLALELDALRLRKDEAERGWAEALATLAPAPAFALGDDFSVPPARFAEFAKRAAEAATPEDRSWADFAAAFACEACFDAKTDLVEDTALRAVGGGQTRVLNFIRELCDETTPRHLHAALFAPWNYVDPPPSMRWDPDEYRPYALRATDPAPDQNNKVRGANRLAIEALPLFPVMPFGSRLQRLATTGFRRHEITWPIWTSTLGMDSVRSVLALDELQTEEPDREKLAALGIVQVMRSRRFTEGQYRNFGPASSLC
jgi:hypothetical protein